MLQGVCLASCLCCVFRYVKGWFFCLWPRSRMNKVLVPFPSSISPPASRLQGCCQQPPDPSLTDHSRVAAPYQAVSSDGGDCNRGSLPSSCHPPFLYPLWGIAEFDYMGGKKQPPGRTVLLLNFFCNFFFKLFLFACCTCTRMHLMDSGAVGPWLRSLNITPNLTFSLKVKGTNQ